MVGAYARHPFDWRSFRVLSAEVASFLEDAAGHGLGLNGLTVPLRAQPAALVLVSFTSDMARDDWEAYKRRHLPNLKTLGASSASWRTWAPSRTRGRQGPVAMLSMLHARLP